MKHNTMLTVAFSALAPLPDASHYGRHRSWEDIEGRELKHCAARPRGLPVRDTRAPRTAIGARHHVAHRIVRSSHARHAHEGGTLRRDSQIPRRLFLRLDTLGARRAGWHHLDPLGARTVGSATEPAPVVQGNGRWRCLPVGCCKSNDQRRSVYDAERSARSGSSEIWTRRVRADQPSGSKPIRSLTADPMRCYQPRYRSVVWMDTRSRSWFTIEECPSPSTYRLFTPASWPRCGARSRRARLARRGGRHWARSGSSFAASRACGLMATTFFSTTTRHSRARRYCATSVSRSRAHLKLRARCTRPKRQGARLPSPSTAARTIA